MTCLADAKIGYAGYSRGWIQPGDRRRFVAYARQRGLQVEPADLKRHYDVVVVTYNGDLPAWIRRKRRQPGLRLIFELVDSYLTQSGLVRSFAKGAARFATGVDSRSHLHFNSIVISMLRTADAVICSTEEQRGMMEKYNGNVHISFDFFDEEIAAYKRNFSINPPLRLVWEGQANTLPNLLSLSGVLNTLSETIELHVVTDVIRFRHLGRFRPIKSTSMLEQLQCPVIFHPWDRSTFATNIVAADAAIIPIDLDNPFAAGKPENKLIMLWKMGMPVIASASPAYSRAMAGAGLRPAAASPIDWQDAIERFRALNKEQRAALAEKGSAYAAQRYSQAEFASRFDGVFQSVGCSV